MALDVPNPLRELLAKSRPLNAAIERLASDAEQLLTDDDMPFFPAYTDHGVTHVNRVLATCVKLVPRKVWESDILSSEDAAAMVGAAILHDLAMHLRPAGFVELVTSPGTFRSRPWFDRQQGLRPPDVPWDEAWASFAREARHFSITQLDQILRPGNAGPPAVVAPDARLDPSAWREDDRLMIGEFLRRHHARLAHEIAHDGFPGASGEFVVLHDAAPDLADVIGAIARSHNEDLRTMEEYFDYKSPGDFRPFGVLVTYVMSVLRIADFTQLDTSRAPILLLRLKAPQSPQSVDEWNKHGAVRSVSWDHRDPTVLVFRVGETHTLRTHLQLRELFDDLEHELDKTTAVLSETYARDEHATLRLTKQRVRTNLDERSLHDQLPYVPVRSALRSADDLFRLVIQDLYGNQPAIAGRELVQNAVDAVRERLVWEKTAGLPVAGYPDLKSDVLVEIAQTDDDRFVLTVVDKGIGMTAETVTRFFLQAGASRRGELAEVDVNPDGTMERMKAGRFGVGAFAAFLLSNEIHVTTRHVDERRGLEFRANIEEDLVDLRWTDCPPGTRVTIPFDASRLPAAPYGTQGASGRAAILLSQVSEFYRMAKPSVEYRFAPRGAPPRSFQAPGDVPAPRGRVPDSWRILQAAPFDGVVWTPLRVSETPASFSTGGSSATGRLYHNGISVRPAVENPVTDRSGYDFGDELTRSLIRKPYLGIFDSAHHFGISLTRYNPIHEYLPFEDRLLRDVGKDIVAFALALERGIAVHPLGTGWGLRPVVTEDGWFPFLPALVGRWVSGELCVVWDGWFRELDARGLAPLDRGLTEGVPELSWDSFPTRVSLPVHTTFSLDPHGDHAFFRLGDVGYWTGVLSRAAGIDVVDAIVLQVDRLDDPSETPTGWTRDDAGPGELATYRWLGGSPDRQEHLDSAARALLGGAGLDHVGITIFGPPAGDPPAHSPLPAAWSEIVGGGLELDPEARRQRKVAAVARDPALRILVGKWERLLARLGPNPQWPPSLEDLRGGRRKVGAAVLDDYAFPRRT